VPQPGWEEPAPAAATVEVPQAEPEPAPEPVWPEAGSEPVAPSAPSDEEELLWFGARAEELAEGSRRRATEPEWPSEDGAAEMEVAGSRSSGGSPFPGSPELRDALSALDALARESSPAGRQPIQQPIQPRETPQAPPPWRASLERPAAHPPQTATPSGPASRAYRRLRRIFPG
jgi:hypothetical protein